MHTIRAFAALLLAGVISAAPTVRETLYVQGPGTPGPAPYSLYDIGREIDRAFLKKYPQYTLQPRTILRLTGQLAMDAMSMAIAGGTAPDIFSVSIRNHYKYVDNGFVLPLNTFIDSLRRSGGSLGIEPQRINQLRYRDKNWFLPAGSPGYTVLYYRKDLFREAGLDRAPANWEELFEFGKKLTFPEKDQWGYGIFGQPQTPNSWRLINFLWQAGAKIFVETSSGRIQPAFNSPEAVTALRFYRDLLRKPWQRDGKTIRGIARIQHYTLWDEFREGRFAMAVWSMGDLLFHQDFDPELVSMAPLPAGPGGIRANMWNQTLIGINSTISPEKRKMAWRYITFRTGPEARAIWVRRHVEAGFGRYIAPDLLRKFGYGRYIEKIPPEWRETYRITKASAVPEPHLDGLYEELDKVTYKLAAFDTVDYKAALDEAADLVSTKLLKWVLPGEMVKRRLTTIVLLGILIGLVCLFFIRFRREFGALLFRRHGILQAGFFKNRHATAWTIGLILPAVATMLIWYYLPLARSIQIAQMDYRLIGESRSVGLDNFIFALWQPEFWMAFGNSLLYVFLTVLLGFLAPLVLALMLDEIPVGKIWFRLAFYLPAIMSTLVITLLWKWFYDPGDEGLFNTILNLVELPSQSWLQDTRLAMLCVVIPGVWSTVGAGSIIYLAALKNIPSEMYEQASIDGAGIGGRLFHITFHFLKPLIIIQLLGTVIGAFHATQRILVMTGGGPLRATHTLGLEIFKTAFYNMRYGYATALAWILGSFIIGFTLFQLRMLRFTRYTSGNR